MNRSQRARINRENARKSTGPKTEEGKARSRMNALKHGLRAETVPLPDDGAAEVHAEWREWAEHYGPDSPGESVLVADASYAAVQKRRCRRFYLAAVGQQVRHAEENWHHGREDEVERLRALLPEDPATATRLLRRSAHGARWLIGRWERLGAVLDEKGRWCGPDRDEAIRLIGARPDQLKDHPDAFMIRLFNLLCAEEPDGDRLAWLLHPERMPEAFRGTYREDWLPDRQDSLDTLRQMVADNLSALRAMEERLRTTLDEPDLAEAGDRALLLGGPEGSLYLRYERMHDLAFQRAYKGILQAQAKADAEEDEDAPSVDGAGQSSADPPTAPNEPRRAGKAPRIHACGQTYDSVEAFLARREADPMPPVLALTAVPDAPTRPD